MYTHALASLAKFGWQVELQDRKPMPDEISRRYSWVPADYIATIETTRRALGPGDAAWLLTSSEFCSDSDSEYAWNEWELQSLEAARGDQVWIAEIRNFWDCHFPILTSLTKCYAYFALQKGTMQVVCGEEPEFTGPTFLANSLADMFERILNRDQSVLPWVEPLQVRSEP